MRSISASIFSLESGTSAATGTTGRPSAYRADFARQVGIFCVLGATDAELAEFFCVNRSTIWRWSQQHVEFCNALKAGKNAADERVLRSLYARAVGYSYDTVKIMSRKGSPVVVPYRKHVPPDTTAAIFWLKNRCPKDWRDKQDPDRDSAPNPIAALLQEMRTRAVRVAPSTEIEVEGEERG